MSFRIETNYKPVRSFDKASKTVIEIRLRYLRPLIQGECTYLFEKDGIKVYRFYDGMEHHYFTSKGETITTQGSSKNHREENIY